MIDVVLRVRTAVGAAVLAAVSLTAPAALGASAAYASCALPPVQSPHAFTGTVLSVESDGRVATVRADDGRTVTVIGGPGEPNTMTSVDRTYQVGVRYEFHPLNGRSPYRDNACTATHKLNDQTPPTSAPPGVGAGGSTGESQRDWSGLSGGLVALAALGVLGLGVVMLSRRWTEARARH